MVVVFDGAESRREDGNTDSNSGKDEGVNSSSTSRKHNNQPQPPKIFDSTLGKDLET